MTIWDRFRRPETTRKELPIAVPPSLAMNREAAIAIRSAIAGGEMEAARKALERIQVESGGTFDFLLLSASIWRGLNSLEQARADCELALELPGLTPIETSEIHIELAQCYLAASELQAAIDALQVALALNENSGMAWLLLGEYQRRAEDHRAAQEAYQRATETLSVTLDIARAWFLLGQSLIYTSDIERAETAFETSLKLDSQQIDSHVGLGNSALWLDDEPRAVSHFEYAVQNTLKPGRLLLLNLGSAYQSCGRFEDASRTFNRVVSEFPDDAAARWYLCQLDLSLCNWQAGWSNYSSRFKSGATLYRPTPFKTWEGQFAKDEVLLVSSDEGLGDEIMYASCLADAKGRVGHLVIECDPRLVSLYKRSFPESTVVGTLREEDGKWLDGVPAPSWQIPSGQLPAIFRNREEEFPHHDGYLIADPVRTDAWKQRLEEVLGAGLKVGISWRGGSVKTRSRARSIPAELWGDILSAPGVNFVNLQYGNYSKELGEINELYGTCVHDFPLVNSDYDDTAALVASLDLVVTVCTAIVHLAGALGKPVWILTPLSPGWRYTAKREIMPWYPSSRIFRQRVWGDWSAPCRELSTTLGGLTKIGSHESLEQGSAQRKRQI